MTVQHNTPINTAAMTMVYSQKTIGLTFARKSQSGVAGKPNADG
jgi:hypothetical protein